jgi:hypothetical protein
MHFPRAKIAVLRHRRDWSLSAAFGFMRIDGRKQTAVSGSPGESGRISASPVTGSSLRMTTRTAVTPAAPADVPSHRPRLHSGSAFVTVSGVIGARLAG